MFDSYLTHDKHLAYNISSLTIEVCYTKFPFEWNFCQNALYLLWEIFATTGWKDLHVANVSRLMTRTLTLHTAWFSIYPKQLQRRGMYTPLVVSQVLHMLWSWKLQQRWPLIKEVDRWHQQSCHVTCVYFTDQKPFLLTSAKNGWWRHKCNFFGPGDSLG